MNIRLEVNNSLQDKIHLCAFAYFCFSMILSMSLDFLGVGAATPMVRIKQHSAPRTQPSTSCTLAGFRNRSTTHTAKIVRPFATDS